ncbi:hypothetical protein LguiA_029598 [Lonicera macranthoides]
MDSLLNSNQKVLNALQNVLNAFSTFWTTFSTATRRKKEEEYENGFPILSAKRSESQVVVVVVEEEVRSLVGAKDLETEEANPVHEEAAKTVPSSGVGEGSSSGVALSRKVMEGRLIRASRRRSKIILLIQFSREKRRGTYRERLRVLDYV